MTDLWETDSRMVSNILYRYMYSIFKFMIDISY